MNGRSAEKDGEKLQPGAFSFLSEEMLSSTIMVILKRNTYSGVLTAVGQFARKVPGEVNSPGSTLASFCLCQLNILHNKSKRKQSHRPFV